MSRAKTRTCTRGRMPRLLRLRPPPLLVLGATFGALIGGCGAIDQVTPTQTPAPTPSATSLPVISCTWDGNEAADALDETGAAVGFICPSGDRDRYRFSVPAGDDLATIELSVAGNDSPLNVSYSVRTADDDLEIAAPEAYEAAIYGLPLRVVHSLGPGEYQVVIRDVGSDVEDVNNAYTLKVSTAADLDANETNDSRSTATVLSEGSGTGLISYRGDQDWFQVQGEPDSLLHLELLMLASGLEPSYEVVDEMGEQVASWSNLSGTREDTAHSTVLALTLGGAYYVVVKDDDQLDADPSTPYILNLSVTSDPDLHEPNDHPSTATSLDRLSCGAEWTDWTAVDGYVSSAGDVDWYALDLDSCDRGLIEAGLVFDPASEVPEGFTASIRLLRAVTGTHCEIDQDCQSLALACSSDLDCAGLGNTCLADGVCGGAGLCLPEDVCGANVLGETALDATPGEVTLSAPLDDLSEAWLAVSDQGSDDVAPESQYRLGVRTRSDPDPLEPSETYTGGPAESDDGAEVHSELASEIPIYDCATGDCCGPDTWTEAILAYDYDQDWFRYRHPCPSEDCMLRLVYELEAGPVDFYFRIYRSTTPWFDNLTNTVDLDQQPSRAGHFGGLSPDDSCFYAYQGHNGDPYWYYLSVRDTIYVSSDQKKDGTWDSSAGQRYRFCLEKVAAGCHAPCTLYSNGCGTEQ